MGHKESKQTNKQNNFTPLFCYLQVLFEMARFYAPSTIFLDELEAIMSQRGSTGGA